MRFWFFWVIASLLLTFGVGTTPLSYGSNCSALLKSSRPDSSAVYAATSQDLLVPLPLPTMRERPDLFESPVISEQRIVPAAGRVDATEAKHRDLRVKTPHDLLIHMVEHVHRMGLLGKFLKERHPELFSEVDLTLLIQYLKYHDNAKINLTRAFQNQYGINVPDAHPLLTLFTGYKEDFRSFPDDIRTMRLASVIEINRVDKKIADDFFHSRPFIAKYGSPQSDSWKKAKRLFKLIEDVADIVDRRNSVVAAEELNIPSEGKETASQWFINGITRFRGSPTEAQIQENQLKSDLAKSIEDHGWAKICQGYRYDDLRNLDEASRARRILRFTVMLPLLPPAPEPAEASSN